MAQGPNVGRAYALLAAVILLWGANWPVMKVGVQFITPLTFAASRMAIAAAFLLALLAVRGRLHLPTRRDWPIVLSVGILQMGLFTGLTTIALQWVEAGRSAILAYTTPLWVVPGAMLLFGERLRGFRLLGVLVGLTGVLLMFNPGAFDWSDPDVRLGNGVLMGAAVLWAAQILHIKGHRWDSPPLELAPWQFLVATLILTPAAVLLEGGTTVVWNWQLAQILLYNGFIATAFCFIAVVSINRTFPAITTSLGMLGVPVAGLTFSAFFLGEPVDATKVAGLASIIGGVALVLIGDRRGASRPDNRPDGASA